MDDKYAHDLDPRIPVPEEVAGLEYLECLGWLVPPWYRLMIHLHFSLYFSMKHYPPFLDLAFHQLWIFVLAVLFDSVSFYLDFK